PGVRDIGAVDDVPGAALPGDAVRKSGRTTGLTNGTVSAVGVAVNINYNCGAVVLTGQVQILAPAGGVFSLPGDSGSGVFDMASPARAVGLLVSGNGV